MYRKLLSAIVLGHLATATAADETYIQVLGIAQDAGYPQTNCYKPHCMRAWEESDVRRMASSIAVVDDARKTKYLFDATPDMRTAVPAAPGCAG